MSQQQPAERKHQTTKPQPTRDRADSAGRQHVHPVLALQGKVGNACIARLLAHTGSVNVQRAAYARFSGVAGEALDEDHKRWITLLGDTVPGGRAPGASHAGGSRNTTTANDVHKWAHALGLTEWKQ